MHKQFIHMEDSKALQVKAAVFAKSPLIWPLKKTKAPAMDQESSSNIRLI